MRKRAVMFGRPALMLAVALVIGLTTFMNPASVHAASKFYLECPTTEVEEGESVEVFLIRIDSAGGNFEARWHTDDITATSADYTQRDGLFQQTNGPQQRANRMGHTLQTTEDALPEGDETFTIRFSPTGSVVDINNPDRDHKCVITILDDDLGITAVEVVSSPLVGDTYGEKETIEISVTYNAKVDVDTYTDNFDLLQPRFTLSVGGTWRSAPYLRGSGTDTLVFGYQVQSGDTDANGVSPLFPKPESTDGRREGRANWDEGAYKGESLGSIGTDVTPQRVFSSRTGPRERSMEAGNRVIVRPDATGCTRGPGGREFGCGGSVADSTVRLGVGWLAVGPGREWPAQPRASPGEDAK